MSDAPETAYCSFTAITHDFRKHFQILLTAKEGKICSTLCTMSNIATTKQTYINFKNMKNGPLKPSEV